MDLPCRPGFNNSLDVGDCLHGGHYVDDLAKQPKVKVSSPVVPFTNNFIIKFMENQWKF